MKIPVFTVLALVAPLIVLLLVCKHMPAINGYAPTCDVHQLTEAMTRAEVIGRCGLPFRVNGSTIGSEQFVYDHNTYIYIKNGKFEDAQWSYQPTVGRP